MTAAHEFALVTKLIGVITKVNVNPSFAFPLLFSPIIQGMDAWREAGNLPDLHLHCLKKLVAYTLRFYKRTQDLDFNIEHPSVYACQECF